MFCLLFASVFCESIVDLVNSNPKATWHAKEYPHLTRARVRSMLGDLDRATPKDKYAPSNDLPESFDARTQWGDVILPVRDQESCGGCWAFATAETAGDRLGILGCGKGNLSPQDLISCDYLDSGCNGGSSPTAFTYLTYVGITTETCLPYASASGIAPSCPTVCNDNSTIIRYKSDSFTYVSATMMQSELYNNGPFKVGFYVYDDFYDYESGIYSSLYGEYLGAHATLLVGWGVENNIPYWTVQNSWGAEWGESGFFRIVRGTNECNIEGNAWAPYFTC